MSYLRSLRLNNFRNYETLDLEGLCDQFIVLTGPNGSGKTNVLEAVSMLSPGRGIRKASPSELQNAHHDASNPADAWGVGATIQGEYGHVPISVSFDPSTGRRLTRIKGEDSKSQSVLNEYLAILWLTPQMDQLFIGGSSDRRRFFDRMIYTAFDGAHAGRITRYENALRQRSKILQDGEGEPAWLDGLERDMADTAVAIAASRLDFVYRLNAASQKFSQSGILKSFPMGTINAIGFVEQLLQQRLSATQVEERFMVSLVRSRKEDSFRGGAKEGPHKTDFGVQHLAKNMPADQCSTGEQKALLVGVILAYAQMVREEKQMMPVLLLDEIAAHFDAKRRDELYELLDAMGGQVWMTGTEKQIFGNLPKNTQFLSVDNGKIAA